MGIRIKLDQYLPDGAARLAEAVFKRRHELGMARDHFGRPSGSTIYSIESARKDCYDTSMLRALEQALGWEPDTVDCILRGQPPKLILKPMPSAEPEPKSPPQQQVLPRAEAQPRTPRPRRAVEQSGHISSASSGGCSRPRDPGKDSSEAASRMALYRLLKTMGHIYGHHWIMNITAEVVDELHDDEGPVKGRVRVGRIEPRRSR